MNESKLGRNYLQGEVIIREGDTSDCMYVIQNGKVEVIKHKNGREVRLAILQQGEFFGEMAIFEKEVRSATVRALEDVNILTIGKRNFLTRIHEDPTLAFNLVKTMAHRLRQLDA